MNVKKSKRLKTLLTLTCSMLGLISNIALLSSCSKPEPQPGPQPSKEWRMTFYNGWRLNYVFGGSSKRQYAPFAFTLGNFVGGEEIEFTIVSRKQKNDSPEICFDNNKQTKRVVVSETLDQISIPIGLNDESFLTEDNAFSFDLKAKIYWEGEAFNEFNFSDMWLIVGQPTTEDMFNIVEKRGIKTLYGFKDDEQTQKRINECSILVIPLEITNIAKNAFFNSHESTIPYRIKYLVLDEYFGTRRSKLQSIGEGAFEKAPFDGLLFFPDSVKYIDMYAFYDTNFSGELTLPQSLITIGDLAFGGCKNFTGDLIIPPYVNTIGDQAFLGCSGFDKRLTFTRPVGDVQPGAFEDCSNIKEIHLEVYTSLPIWLTKDVKIDIFRGFGDVGRVYVGAYFNVWQEKIYSICSLPSEWLCQLDDDLIIPEEYLELSSDGEELIGIKSGVSLASYNKLMIPVGVKTIRENAFKEIFATSKAPIKEIDFYNGTLTEIGPNAFFGCTNLIGDVNFPPGVQTVGRSAFDGCSNITGIILPQSLVDIGDLAFANCPKLSKINMENFAFLPPWVLEPRENSIFKNISKKGAIITHRSVNADECWNQICNNCGLEKRWNVFSSKKIVPNSCLDLSDDKTILYGIINYDKYKDCDTLVLPDTVKHIYKNAFSKKEVWDSKIKNFIFDNGILESIGESAFEGCTNFTGHICFPDSLEKIEKNAFVGSNFGRYLFMPNNLTNVANDIFKDCKNIKEIDLQAYGDTKPTWLTTSLNIFNFGPFADGGSIWFNDKLNSNQLLDWRFDLLSSQSLPYSWVSTSQSRIIDTKCMKFEDGGKTLAGINWDEVDTSIKDTIKIPWGVTKIKSWAFSNLPSKVQKIKNIDFCNGTLVNIEDNAFNQEQGSSFRLNCLYLPSTLEEVGEKAFYESYIGRALVLGDIWNIRNSCFEKAHFYDDALQSKSEKKYILELSGINPYQIPEWYKREGSKIFLFQDFQEKDAKGQVIYYYSEDQAWQTALKMLKDGNKTSLDVDKNWSDWVGIKIEKWK